MALIHHSKATASIDTQPVCRVNPQKRNKGPSASSKHHRRRTKKHKLAYPLPATPIHDKDIDDNDDIYIPNSPPGQFFHMDFGFVRGTNFTIKQEDGPTITSKDGYNLYLIIVDHATRYTWIFLTKTKQPPVSIARRVLQKFNPKIHIALLELTLVENWETAQNSVKWCMMKAST